MKPLLRPEDRAPVSTDDLAKAALENEEELKQVAAAPEPEKQEPEPEPKSQTELWLEGLKAAKVTEEQADAVLSELLSKGYYERTYPLFNGKFSVTFRTRDGAALTRAADAVDRAHSNDRAVHQQIMARLNLAASLVKFDKRALPHAPANANPEEREKAFQQRLAFVDSQELGPFLPALFNALSRFDFGIMAITNQGAPEGF